MTRIVKLQILSYLFKSTKHKRVLTNRRNTLPDEIPSPEYSFTWSIFCNPSTSPYSFENGSGNNRLLRTYFVRFLYLCIFIFVSVTKRTSSVQTYKLDMSDEFIFTLTSHLILPILTIIFSSLCLMPFCVF